MLPNPFEVIFTGGLMMETDVQCVDIPLLNDMEFEQEQSFQVVVTGIDLSSVVCDTGSCITEVNILEDSNDSKFYFGFIIII